MTREEAIAYGEDYLKDLISACCHIEEKHKDFVRMAIKALEQEPCEDAVSRQTVDQNIYDYAESNGLSYANLKNAILDTPSVTPTHKAGKWIEVKNKNGTVIALRCNCCEKSPKHAIRSLWCPNCGAEMEE